MNNVEYQRWRVEIEEEHLATLIAINKLDAEFISWLDGRVASYVKDYKLYSTNTPDAVKLLDKAQQKARTNRKK